MTVFDFKPIPEVYQLEATNACQLGCLTCPREDAAIARNGIKHLDLDALQVWIDRGDFSGSYFVELQASGEPLLHPRLNRLVSMLKGTGVLVGLSTNGLLLEEKAHMLGECDALTISLDTMHPGLYGEMRPTIAGYPGDWNQLARNIDALLASPHCPPFVDLQLLAMLGTDRNIEREKESARDRWDDPRVHVRHVDDCFALIQNRATFDTGKDLCVNPWLSVSVLSNGSVASCCYAWGQEDANIYGNLNDQSLRDIWDGPKVKALRRSLLCGQDIGHCKDCYLRSPFKIHLGMMPTIVRRIGRRA